MPQTVKRGVAAISALLFLAGAHTAEAGINVWTSNGPGVGYVGAVATLAIDPVTPSTLYAGYYGGGVFGDCDDSGDVRVSELVTLMNIGLGDTPPSACPNGVPEDTAVDIALIVQAVDNGLHGCGFAAE